MFTVYECAIYWRSEVGTFKTLGSIPKRYRKARYFATFDKTGERYKFFPTVGWIPQVVYDSAMAV